MKKLNTILILFSIGFISNCAIGKITRSTTGGRQSVHVSISGTNLFNTPPSKSKFYQSANASLEQCEKWLAIEGARSGLETLNNATSAKIDYGSARMNLVEFNEMNDSLLYKGPFSIYSSTRAEGCEAIGSK